MNKEEIITITKSFLSDEFEINSNQIISENNFHKTLDLDSLDYVDLVVVIEENFRFKPTSDDFKNIISFNDFYDLVEKKLK